MPHDARKMYRLNLPIRARWGPGFALPAGKRSRCRWRAQSTPIRRAWPRLRRSGRFIFPAAAWPENSLCVPDLGISTMEDVLADVRRIVEAKRGCLWSVDRQVGSASRQLLLDN